jgi:2-haloacid dehalogenase
VPRPAARQRRVPQRQDGADHRDRDGEHPASDPEHDRELAYAARLCSVPVGQMLLVAAHPWDIHGAREAGMRAGWIVRRQAPYPGYFAAPDFQAPDLGALAGQILS